MSTPAEKGFISPTGNDWISEGDNAIAKNALATIALYDELKSEQWMQGRAANGMNWNTHRKAGVLIVYSKASAESMIGLPENEPGFMETFQNDAGSTIIAGQRYTLHVTGTVYERPSLDSSTYSPWELKSSDVGDLGGSDLLANVKLIGAVKAPNHTTIADMPPGAGPGTVFTVNSKTFTVMKGQLYFEYGGTGSNGRLFYRVSNTFTTYGSWVDLTGGGSGSAAGLANKLRLDDFSQRWGGSKKYPNKAVIAFRYDHGLANFNSIVRPVHESKNMPYTIALGSRHWANAENAGVTAAMVNTWAAGPLCTIANHSALSASGHVDGVTAAQLHDLIVVGLAELKAQIPNAMIDMFIIPGVGGTGLNGLLGGSTPEQFYDTEAGRMILTHHALSSGTFPTSQLKVLDGEPRQGMAHQGYDTTPVATVKAKIDEAIAGKRGLNLFLHPSKLNEAGYLTTADFMSIVNYVDAARTAGKLEVLSMYELQLADSRPTTRVDNSVGRRVYAWDQANGRDQMIYGDTGLRDITALAPNVTAGKLYLQREGNEVSLVISDVVMSGATGSNYDLIPNGGIPAGFRPPFTHWYNGIDGPPGQRRVGVAVGGWAPVYLSPVPGDFYRGKISWTTQQLWPTSLPGVAVGSIPA